MRLSFPALVRQAFKAGPAIVISKTTYIMVGGDSVEDPVVLISSTDGYIQDRVLTKMHKVIEE